MMLVFTVLYQKLLKNVTRPEEIKNRYQMERRDGDPEPGMGQQDLINCHCFRPGGSIVHCQLLIVSLLCKKNTAMYRFLSFGLLLLFFVSCGNVRTIKPSEVEFLFVDIDPDTPTNYGSPFPAMIGAQMKTGEIRYLKDNSDFVCSYNIVCRVKDKRVEVVDVPQSFDADRVTVSLKMGNKQGDTVYSTDTLRLNFRSGVKLGTSLRKAQNGTNGASGSTPLLFRDGKNGDAGGTGQNGTPGDSYDIHIWKDSDTYFLHVRNLTTGLVGRYQIRGDKPFELNASGGDGGDGGNGGTGGDGKNGSGGDKPKYPGNGGTGGPGGSGGSGGDGGTIRCVLHPSALDFRAQVKLSAAGGRGGSGGKGGQGGKAGTPATGQGAANNGATGGSGWNGLPGRPGVVTFVNEDFSTEGLR
jgi:hypothetical protein